MTTKTAKTSEIEYPVPTGDLARERERAAHRIRASARAYVAALLAADAPGQQREGAALEESGRSLGEIDQAIELSDLAGGRPPRSARAPEPRSARLLSIADPTTADPRKGVPTGELVASALSLLLDATGMNPFDVAIRSGIPEATVRSLLDGDQPATLATVASVGRAAGGQLIFGFVPSRAEDSESSPPISEEIEAAALAFATDPGAGNRRLVRAALRLASRAGVPGAAARAEGESLRSLRDLVLAIRDDLARGVVPEDVRSVDSLDAALARRAIYAHAEQASGRTEHALSPRSAVGSDESTSRWIVNRTLLLRAIFAVREVKPGETSDRDLAIEVSIDDRTIARGSTLEVDQALRESDVWVQRGEQIVVRSSDPSASWLTIVPIVVWAQGNDDD